MNELRDLQLKGLEILLYFKKFCEENNLKFYLCGGCCIGAIRHEGFIPWDDDVDVFMPRSDYEKLHVLWDKLADTKRYECVYMKKDNLCRQIFTTISDASTTMIKPDHEDLDIPHGVTIDVFPLDGCPESRIKRYSQMFWALIYSLYFAQVVPKNHGKGIELIGKFMLNIVPSEKYRYKIGKFAEKNMSKYSIADCKYITELCAGPHYMKNEYTKEIFSGAVYKEFEGYKLPLPKGYDDYLHIAFGDYMKLPAKEKQIPHHDAIFLDLTTGYKNYKGKYYCKGDRK